MIMTAVCGWLVRKAGFGTSSDGGRALGALWERRAEAGFGAGREGLDAGNWSRSMRIQRMKGGQGGQKGGLLVGAAPSGGTALRLLLFVCQDDQQRRYFAGFEVTVTQGSYVGHPDLRLSLGIVSWPGLLIVPFGLGER